LSSDITLVYQGTRYAFNCKAHGVDDDSWFHRDAGWVRRYGVQWVRGTVLRELWTTRNALRSVYWHSYGVRRADYHRHEHWVHLLFGLLQQAFSWKVKLDLSRLAQIVELAETDARTAYHYLAAVFQRALGRRQDRLERHLRVLSKFRSIFYNLLCRSYSLRNLISSQRSWFLYHGAHPSDVPTLSVQGCFLRVCFQPA
jgi:hypothetical protein